MGDEQWPADTADPAEPSAAGGLPVPWRRPSASPRPGQGAKDPYFDRLGTLMAELDDTARGLGNRGTDIFAARRSGTLLAQQAKSWEELHRLVRRELSSSQYTRDERSAKELIDAAGNAYSRHHGGAEAEWRFKLGMEEEYRRGRMEARRERAGRIARELEHVEELEYEEFLRQLEFIRNLPDLRLMRVDTRQMTSSLFRMSGAAQPIQEAAEALDFVKPYIDVALDFIPVVGQIKAIAEVAIGRNLLTGQELTVWERGLNGALLLLPFAKGAFGIAKAGIGTAGRATSRGMLRLAALAHQVAGKNIAPRALHQGVKGLSRIDPQTLQTVANIAPGTTLTAGQKAALGEVAEVFGGLETGGRLGAASGVIEEGRVLSRTRSPVSTAKASAPAVSAEATALRTTSEAAQPLIHTGYRPDAILALEKQGVKVTSKLATQLAELGDTGRDFLNLFHQSSGFHRVIQDLSLGGKKADGAKFAMRYATQESDILKKVRADPMLIHFEWQISKTTGRSAREIDLVVRGDGGIGVGHTVYTELKNWTANSLHAAKYKKLPRQFIRDLALLDPAAAGSGEVGKAVRWVFNRAKIPKKGTVIEIFLEAIQSDRYLRSRWGTDNQRIGEALDSLITLWPK
ncbi:pre-toxin TG domain-containing protein [Streptomyces sp. NPDC054847]